MTKKEERFLAQIHFRSKSLKLQVLTIRLGGIPISHGHNAKTVPKPFLNHTGIKFLNFFIIKKPV